MQLKLLKIDNQQLAETLAIALQQHHYFIATAESCTGGGLAACLTDLAGSSQWFDGGFVSYSNAAKTQMLGIPASLIAEQGAVSQAVAIAMATAVISKTKADIGVSITGIAGPTGGSSTKPVGTVWLAWACKTGLSLSNCFVFQGDRERIRLQAIQEALKGCIACIKKG